MYNILHDLLGQFSNVAQNQFLSGGLVLGILGGIAMSLKSIPSKILYYAKRYCTVVVDVNNTDAAYNWILYWLESQHYGKNTKRMSIKNVKTKDGATKTLLVPARGDHWFFYKHRPLWLSREVDKEALVAPMGGMDGGGASADPKERIKIRVLSRSRKIVEDLVTDSKKIYESSDTGMLYVHRYQWGDWRHMTKVIRPMESVFLPKGGETLLSEIQTFVNHESWYRKMGIPYRRGYLFTGPPGTGKSSTAEAIAGALGLPIYILNLAGLYNANLEAAISSIDNLGTAILLIEDVDTVMLKREQATATQTFSLGTLLNALDGIQAADNVILIMTSNNPDNLDKALTRKGRVDRTIEFGLASEEQITAAIKRFLPETTLEQCRQIAEWPRPLSMAEVQERLKDMVVV